MSLCARPFSHCYQILATEFRRAENCQLELTSCWELLTESMPPEESKRDSTRVIRLPRLGCPFQPPRSYTSLFPIYSKKAKIKQPRKLETKKRQLSDSNTRVQSTIASKLIAGDPVNHSGKLTNYASDALCVYGRLDAILLYFLFFKTLDFYIHVS